MVYKKAKVFWKINSNPKHIFCLPFDDNMEYYTFLKKCHNDGYRQVIITSEIMVKLIKDFVLKKELSVYNIEFIEEDNDLKDEISELLIEVHNDKSFFSELIEKLNFLSEKSSIDIQRVYFKGRNSNNIAISLYIQSNGIIGIDSKNYDFISREISNLIERCLF